MRFISAAVLLIAAGTLQGVLASVIKTSGNTTVDKPMPHSLGNNCRDSARCNGGSASTLKNLICGISSGNFYNDGQQIACDRVRRQYLRFLAEHQRPERGHPLHSP
jgi:hypothetical protein